MLSDLVGEPVEVWPVSALAALEPGRVSRPDDRFDDFAAAFGTYVTVGSGGDLRRSLATRASHLAMSIKDRADSSLAASSLADSSERAALRDFAERLHEIERDRSATLAHVDTVVRELISGTDEAASELARRTQPHLAERLTAFFSTTDETPRAAEEAGLALAEELIRTRVEEWRAAWREHLDARLSEAQAELEDRLRRHIAAVRTAAADLFHVELSSFALQRSTVAIDTFSFQFAAAPGQYDTMAATLRRTLPARVTRRWVARHVHAQAAALLDRQVGRARSQFQGALTDSGRAIRSALSRQYDDGAGGLVEAIRVGSELRRSTQTALAATVRSLRERSEAADQLIASLTDATRLP